MGTRILVLGDHAVGRHLGAALATDPAIECVIATREPDQVQAFADHIGAGVVAMDIADSASLGRALDGVYAVINTVGPFVPGSYPVAQRCAACGVHYVDLASASRYVAGVSTLNRRARTTGSLVVAGATVVPAVSGALVDYLAREFDRVSEIHTAIAPPDNRARWFTRARAVHALAGRPMRLKQRGHWRDTYGWSEPERVDFPPPVGRRRVYLCDVVDLTLFPQRYGAQTVTFRAGLARPLLNYGMAILGRLSRKHHRRVSKEAQDAQTTNGGLNELLENTKGIRVLVRGKRDGQEITRTVSLIGRDDSAMAIACSPVIALVRAWVREGITDPGARPCIDLVNLEAIKTALLGNDIVLVRN
ncbi:MAG: saccharopine dehydrogenase family protein [Acidiferrobacterales bacterium]